MDERAQGVHRHPVHQDVQLDQPLRLPVGEAVVHAGVALGARLELVVEVHQHLGQGHAVLQHHAALALADAGGVVQVVHADELAAAAGDQVHDGADMAVGGDDGDVHPGLADLVDARGVGQVGGGVDLHDLAVGEERLVPHVGRGGQKVHLVLALQPLLDDVHVEEAEEAGAEAGPQGQ